jgi:predicted DNA-binding protein
MVLSFKVPAWMKTALQDLAEKEHRPLSNYILHVLIEHLENKGIKPPKNQ